MYSYERINMPIKFFFLLLIVCIYPGGAFALDDSQKRVVGIFDSEASRNPVGIREVYGAELNVINHYISNLGSTATTFNIVTPDAAPTSIQINTQELVQRALAMWTPAEFTFNSIAGYPERGRRGILIELVDIPTDESLAWTIFNNMGTTGQTRIRVNRSFIEQHGESAYRMALYNHSIDAGISLRSYIEMLFFNTILHEVGHGLGLTHPLLNGQFDSNNNYCRTIVPASITQKSPTIMLDGATQGQSYFGVQAGVLGRGITIDDISPSTSDIAGARIMYRGGAYFLWHIDVEAP